MVRKRIKRSLECLHIFLILSVIAPVIYMGDVRRDPQQLYQLYFTGYLLLLPVAAIMTASKRCKEIWKYLLVVIGAYLIVSLGAKQLGVMYLDEVANMIYGGCMKICALVVAFLAFAMRIYMARRQEAREVRDASWVEAEIRYDKPNKMVCLWFVMVYLYALNMACPQVCNIALYSTLAYVLVTIAYEYLDRTQEYVKHNEDACQVQNIPYRRIYGIGKFFLLVQLVLLLFTIVPAILTIGSREYRDIRTNNFEIQEVKKKDDTQSSFEVPKLKLVEPEIEPAGARNKALIRALDTILYSISAVIMVILLLVVINLIRREIAKFAQSVQEEDDVVESLKALDEEEPVLTQKIGLKKTEEDKVRRMYRKFIRKHRKDRPAVYETPIEIETAAGVADTTEGKTLHEKYELARYGR